MLQAGKLITQNNDPLVKIHSEYFYNAVKNPKPKIITAIRQLRVVKTIDEKKYRNLKKRLPYVTCGIFNPSYRKTENFGWTNHFIVDIDHISEKQLDVVNLKNLLKKDQRVELIFCSPGEDGLKLLFKLSEKCFDAGQYSLFYKIFIHTFSQQYHLEQIVDTKTSDITRACFISYDPDAYYNSSAQPVKLTDFINTDSPFEMSELKHFIDKEEKKNDTKSKDIEHNIDPDEEVMNTIKARLNPNSRAIHKKQIYVPKEIDEIIDKVKDRMAQFEIDTTEIKNIHYGKKFKFKLKLKEAEINVFYGKHGYTVVMSPRRGTNTKLNEVCSGILNDLFYG